MKEIDSDVKIIIKIIIKTLIIQALQENLTKIFVLIFLNKGLITVVVEMSKFKKILLAYVTIKIKIAIILLLIMILI